MVRGINVGGARPLKMDTLRGLHEGLGHRSPAATCRAATWSSSRTRRTRSPTPPTSSGRSSARPAMRFRWGRGPPGPSSAILARNPLVGRASLDPPHGLYSGVPNPPAGRADASGSACRSRQARRRSSRGASCTCIAQTGTARPRSTTTTSSGCSRPARPPGTGARSRSSSAWAGGRPCRHDAGDRDGRPPCPGLRRGDRLLHEAASLRRGRGHAARARETLGRPLAAGFAGSTPPPRRGEERPRARGRRPPGGGPRLPLPAHG